MFVVPVLVIAPSPVMPSWLVALALFLVPVPFLARRLAYGRLSVGTPQDLPLILLLVMLSIGIAVTADMKLTFLVAKRTALILAIFFCLVNAINRQEQVARGAAMLVGVGLIIAGVGLVGMNLSFAKLPVLQVLLPYLPHKVMSALNAAGFNANIVGGSLAMIIPVNVGLVAAKRGLARGVFLLVLLTLLAVAILTLSRGALIGLAVGLWLLAIAANRLFVLALPTALLCAGGAMLYVGPQALADLVLSLDTAGGTFAGRLEVWNRAIYMVQDFPFTGIGAGTFPRVLPVLYPLFLASPDSVIPHAHQMYLQAAVDFGLPGFVAFIALLTMLSLVGIDSIRRADASARWLAVGFFAGFLVYLVHGFMDDITFSAKAAAVLWIVLGLMVAQWRLVRCLPGQPKP